jgi:hypothetical protein
MFVVGHADSRMSIVRGRAETYSCIRECLIIVCFPVCFIFIGMMSFRLTRLHLEDLSPHCPQDSIHHENHETESCLCTTGGISGTINIFSKAWLHCRYRGLLVRVCSASAIGGALNSMRTRAKKISTSPQLHNNSSQVRRISHIHVPKAIGVFGTTRQTKYGRTFPSSKFMDVPIR